MKSLKFAALLLVGSLIGLQAHAAGSCTNFSGQWQGQCSSSTGEFRNLKMSIAQSGCESVIYNGSLFPIAQVVETRIPQQPGYPPSYNVAYEMMDLVNGGKELYYSFYGTYYRNDGFTNPAVIDMSTHMKFVGRNLVTTTVDSVNNFSETCQYSKR